MTETPPEQTTLTPCDCCGVPVSYRRGSIWHEADQICAPCFFIWYDGAVDSRSRSSIKAERLRIYGQEDTRECRI
jgi:hypothetical protein